MYMAAVAEIITSVQDLADAVFGAELLQADTHKVVTLVTDTKITQRLAQAAQAVTSMDTGDQTDALATV
jgi:hypothetical protein